MKKLFLNCFVVFAVLLSCAENNSSIQESSKPESEKDFYDKLSDAAISIIDEEIVYDPTYFVLPYPNGDVPANKGVCTDVVIRAYRKMGIDLQKLIHEDMTKNFSLYPSKKRWGLTRTDKNIDHRRVLNQEVFFARFGTVKPKTTKPEDYLPGDIVTWILPGNLPHVGIVIDQKSSDGKRYMVVHNIGRGQIAEDCLFSWNITGHFRYGGKKK